MCFGIIMKDVMADGNLPDIIFIGGLVLVKP